MTDRYWQGNEGDTSSEQTNIAKYDYEGDVSTYAISATANDGGNAKFTCADHGGDIVVGCTVTISGTTSYNGEHKVITVADSTHFTIDYAYSTADSSGNAVSHNQSNWRLCDTDGGCAIPATGDTIYFDDRAYDNETDDRKQDCDINTGETYTSYADLAGLYVKSGYDGHIGAADEYLVVEVSGNVIVEGGCVLYLACGKSSGDGEIETVMVNHASALVYLASHTNDASDCDVISLLYLVKGSCYLEQDNNGTPSYDNPWVPTIYVVESTATLVAREECYRKKATIAYSTIYMTGGSATWDSQFDSLYIFGAGTFTWGSDRDRVADNDFRCELVQICRAGTFNWTPNDDNMTNTPYIKQFRLIGDGCILDASLDTNAGIPKQIGSGSGEDSEIWGSSAARLNSPSDNVQFGSGSVIENHGGAITTPNNEDIAW